MRVAIFGGSFDPPHTGHLTLVKQVLAAGLVDEIWLMPTYISPGKRANASAQDRLAMCRLLAKLVNKQVKVSNLETQRKGESYTVDTVGELKKRFKSLKFYWLIGSDLVRQLSQWERQNQLLKEIEFIVFPKTGVSSTLIRERIRKKQTVTDLVPRKVEEYIKKHRLYV